MREQGHYVRDVFRKPMARVFFSATTSMSLQAPAAVLKLQLAEIETLVAWHKQRVAELEQQVVALRRAQTKCEHDYIEVDLGGPRDNGERHYRCRFCRVSR